MNSKFFKILLAGLLLVLFNLGYNVSAFTTFIGIIILLASFWKLRNQNKYFIKSLAYGVMFLIVQTLVLLLLSSSEYINNFLIKCVLSVATAVLMTLVVFNFFKGLKAMLADAGQEQAADKFRDCIIANFVAAFLIVLNVIDKVFIFMTLPFLIPIFVIYLIRINQLKNIFQSKPFKKVNIVFAIITTCYIIGTGMLVYSVLQDSNAKYPVIKPYNKADVQVININDIRTKMLNAGYDKEILNELPDSEVAEYEDIQSFHITKSNIKSDGGELMVANSISVLKDGNFRCLVYYKWLKNPRHAYTDVIGIIPSGVSGTAEDWVSYHIYNKNSESIVYKLDDTTDKSLVRYPCSRFRILGKDVSNQRGFIAFNARSLSKTCRTSAVYCHQSSIFNVPYKDPLTYFQTFSPKVSPNALIFKRYILSQTSTY